MNTAQIYDLRLYNADHSFGFRLSWNSTKDSLKVLLSGNDRRHCSGYVGPEPCEKSSLTTMLRTARTGVRADMPIVSIVDLLEGAYAFSDGSKIRLNFDLQSSSKHVFCELIVDNHCTEARIGVRFAMTVDALQAAACNV